MITSMYVQRAAPGGRMSLYALSTDIQIVQVQPGDLLHLVELGSADDRCHNSLAGADYGVAVVTRAGTSGRSGTWFTSSWGTTTVPAEAPTCEYRRLSRDLTPLAIDEGDWRFRTGQDPLPPVRFEPTARGARSLAERSWRVHQMAHPAADLPPDEHVERALAARDWRLLASLTRGGGRHYPHPVQVALRTPAGSEARAEWIGVCRTRRENAAWYDAHRQLSARRGRRLSSQSADFACALTTGPQARYRPVVGSPVELVDVPARALRPLAIEPPEVGATGVTIEADGRLYADCTVLSSRRDPVAFCTRASFAGRLVAEAV